jgi:hypothetical protein
MEIHIFSTDGVRGVKNLNTCVLYFCLVSVVWSAWVHGSFSGF